MLRNKEEFSGPKLIRLLILDSWLSLISAVIPLEVSDIFSAALKFDEFSWVVNARAYLWVSITVRSSRLEGDSQIVVFLHTSNPAVRLSCRI